MTAQLSLLLLLLLALPQLKATSNPNTVLVRVVKLLPNLKKFDRRFIKKLNKLNSPKHRKLCNLHDLRLSLKCLDSTRMFWRQIDSLLSFPNVRKFIEKSLLHDQEEVIPQLKKFRWLTLVRENIFVDLITSTASIQEVLDKLSKGMKVPVEEQMKHEMLRLRSFQGYPTENKPFVIRFAQAGFYYSGRGDEVVCFVCMIRVRNWKEADDPMKVHKSMSPSCQFLINKAAVNIPIGRNDQANDAYKCDNYCTNGAEGGTTLINCVPQPAKGNSNEHPSGLLHKPSTMSAATQSNLDVYTLPETTEKRGIEGDSMHHKSTSIARSSETFVGNVCSKGEAQQQISFTTSGRLCIKM